MRGAGVWIRSHGGSKARGVLQLPHCPSRWRTSASFVSNTVKATSLGAALVLLVCVGQADALLKEEDDVNSLSPSPGSTSNRAGSLPRPADLGLNLQDDFFTKYYERRWALMRARDGKARELFRSLWSLGKVLRHANGPGFHAYDRGIPRPKADPGNSHEFGSGAKAAEAALRAGLSLVQNHVHRNSASLAGYLRQVTAYLGVSGGFNSYTTPPGATGFAHHFDPSDALILQVVGSKKWEFCKLHLANPLSFSNQTYNQIAPDHESAQGCAKHILREGDVAYLPIGQVHRATASDSLSIHLTLSLNRQFLSGTALLLNVAEQINPSKDVGFSQKPFVAWLNRAAADPNWQLLKAHHVPLSLVCGGKRSRCSTDESFLEQSILRITDLSQSIALQAPAQPVSEGVLEQFVVDMRTIIDMFIGHPDASKELLPLKVRVSGKSEPVLGRLPPKQVLEGVKSLLKIAPCRRVLASWRDFFLRQHAEFDEIIFREEAAEKDFANLLFISDRSSPSPKRKPKGGGLNDQENQAEEEETEGQRVSAARPSVLDEKSSEDLQREPGPAGSCCDVSSALEQLRCANSTAPPIYIEGDDDPRRVLIVTYATPHVHTFARYSLVLNAMWARRFGHSLVVDTRDLATGGFDVKNAKVLVKKYWVAHPSIAEQWVLWIGADAIFVDFKEHGTDVLREIISRHCADPRVQVVITRDPHGRAGNSMSLFNADVILLRRSDWTAKFLQRWWNDPRMKEGRTDQEVLELLYTEDVLGASRAFVLLPAMTLNSDTLSIIGGPPSEQPVVHLGGHADSIRAELFKKALARVCASEVDGGRGLDRTSNELQDVYLELLWKSALDSKADGISSGHRHTSTIMGTFHRLAWHLEQRNRGDEAIRVHRSAVSVAKKTFGPKERDTLHAMTALGGALRSNGKLPEAEDLHRRALRGLTAALGSDHRDTLTGMNNLALVLERQQRLSEAEGLYRRAFSGMVKTLGAEAPGSLAAAFNLASAITSQSMGGTLGANSKRKLDEAERLHRAALRGRKRVYGDADALTYESQESLAQLLVMQSRASEAEPMLRARLKSTTSGGDRNNQGRVQSISSLGQALKMLSRPSEALEQFRMAYELCRDTPSLGGPDNPNTYAAGANYATALQEIGRYSEAGLIHRQAALGLQRLLGPNHPNARSARANYDFFTREFGSREESKEYSFQEIRAETEVAGEEEDNVDEIDDTEF